MGFDMQQNRFAIPCWSYLAEIKPPKRILEIGTYQGGLSVPLAIMARNYQAQFVTFDITQQHKHNNGIWFDLLKMDFRQIDVFSENGKEIVRKLLKQPGRSYVLCDNGNKVDEFNLFSGMIKSGDVIAGHDYYIDNLHWRASEIHEASIAESVSTHHLQLITNPPFMEAAWLAYEKI